jgi:glycolate oxidase
MAPHREQLLQVLRRATPSLQLLASDEELRPYECDAYTLRRALPLLVALPADHRELQTLLQVCAAEEVPVVARGAGTGLSGGALPHAGGVLVSMARFNRILALDPVACTAVVEPGVRNLAISEAAAVHRLFYAPDPSSQIACTIGGNVAENSGGVHCLKYGLTLHNVLAVRGFTANGEPASFGGLAPNEPGLDLLSLVVGSEGMLLIITEVVVRLAPLPSCARCVLASFADIAVAGDAVAAIIAAGIIPAGLEMMDQGTVRLVEPHARAGYDLAAAAILLCEADGTEAEVDGEIERMSAVLRAHGASNLRVSRDESERLRFWSGRKNAFPAAGRAAPAYYCMDGTIPRRMLGTMLKDIEALSRHYALGCINVFHAGDGNLHPLIMFDDNDADSVRRAEEFGAAILERTLQLGGTITGEHGVGAEKLDQMCLQFGNDERECFTALKRAFDPHGLLNPGKVIPTLHRCAEFGRMRVSGGRLQFPELPRL